MCISCMTFGQRLLREAGGERVSRRAAVRRAVLRADARYPVEPIARERRSRATFSRISRVCSSRPQLTELQT